MPWTVTLLAEIKPGQRIAHEVMAVNRDDRITPATLGLSIGEGKTVLARPRRGSSWIRSNANCIPTPRSPSGQW
jgi:hypothetical protein